MFKDEGLKTLMYGGGHAYILVRWKVYMRISDSVHNTGLTYPAFFCIWGPRRVHIILLILPAVCAPGVSVLHPHSLEQSLMNYRALGFC